MSSNPEFDIPVLVVGGGPTGLMLAGELARHGVACRIIEKTLVPSERSRALVVHARTLEIMESIGIAEQALALGVPAHAVNLATDSGPLARLTFDELDSHYKFALMLPQNLTERVLTQHLEGLGLRVERGVELLSFIQSGTAVEAVLRHADGQEERCRAGYLAGCDGAHSTVRNLLQLPFEGAEYPELFALADIQVDWSRPEDELFMFIAERGVAAFFPMGSGRYRIIADTPDESEQNEPTVAELQNLVNERGAGDARLGSPHWLARFRIHRRRVSSYRVGRVFVAGDAAHIHSPAGGQGMNTGIQDAHNLAWKLALVLRGAGRPELLDSYHREREAIAANVLRTTDAMTRVITFRNPIAVTLRNHLIPILSGLEVFVQAAAKQMAELDVNYRKSPIVGEYRESLLGSLRAAVRGEKSASEIIDFVRGPAPGDRAPDVENRSSGGSTRRLFELLRGTEHHLLLFAGAQPKPGDLATLDEFALAVAARYPGLIGGCLIAPAADPTSQLKSKLIVDADLAMHRAYGAGAPCLYLIRPDGYIGFRSQPVDRPQLETYLNRIFL